MKTLILDGSPEDGGLDVWIKRYAARLTEKHPGVETVALRELGIRTCTGCWSCWWATPGRCVHKDGMETLYPKIIASDLIVWATPLVLGAQCALTKKAQDRMIPLIHPYFELVQGESHHRRRYAHYPSFALVVDPAGTDGEADLALVRRLFERFALNFRSGLAWFATTAEVPEEAADETRCP